jgi:hypothetical protein
MSDDKGPANLLVAYDPIADAWGPVIALCHNWMTQAAVVWTGCDLLVWLSWSVSNIDPAPLDVFRFDGDTVWQASAEGAPSPRMGSNAVWTGDAMIAWGAGFHDDAPSGAIYRPR